MRRSSRSVWLLALLVSGCVHERSKSVGTFPEGVLARSDVVEAPGSSSAWSKRAFERTAPPPPPPPVEAVPVTVEEHRVGRSDAPPAHRAIPAGESLDDRARSKFVSATTEIAAERATLYVPRAIAAEVSLVGSTVADDGPGSRTATGSAVATLRRLTIRASRLTVVVRDANPDVQLSARGDVYFRSDQPASVIEESGLRSLLLKNDGYTPLR